MPPTGEVWLPVVGYEGLYEVSNLGRIRSLDRVVPHRRHGSIKLRGVMLSLGLDANGSNVCTLSKDGCNPTVHVRNVVARAWLGECPQGHIVQNGDYGRANNAVYNLSFVSVHTVVRRRGTAIGIPRPVRRSDGVQFESLVKAAEVMGCTHQNISCVCNGKTRTARGYGWEYI